MIDPLLDADYLQAQYERLRAEGLQVTTWERGHGLPLFVSRGMAAWMKALSTLAPRPDVPAEANHPPSAAVLVEMPEAARSDLTAVLATMVLGCREGGRP